MALTSPNLSLSTKLALISTGVLSVAVIFKIYAPAATDFVASEVPVMYSSFAAWLRPPYLYLVVNGIIISIVASSKMQLQKDSESSKLQVVIQPPPSPAVVADEFSDERSNYRDLKAAATLDKNIESDDDEVATPLKTVQLSPPPQRSEPIEELLEKVGKEKPLVSKRFSQKKSAKASPEVLGVAEWRREDTLENTWKKITEGRGVPLSRHLMKSDTWDTDPAPPRTAEKMKKSETFSENRRGESGKLRKEPSLSQEELNRRVEAFINKFNEEMRLQRQESLNQYQQMIARGAY